MEKEHLRKEKMKSMDEKKREEEQKLFEEMSKKHKKHPKLHHPVSIETSRDFSLLGMK